MGLISRVSSRTYSNPISKVLPQFQKMPSRKHKRKPRDYDNDSPAPSKYLKRSRSSTDFTDDYESDNSMPTKTVKYTNPSDYSWPNSKSLSNMIDNSINGRHKKSKSHH